jgi:phosphatidylserine/phosphatidylglycerophosphate/cardiolipin synthase-like enzyme
MASLSSTNGAFSLKAYRGDAKTLLAFNLSGAEARKNLAGFTIQVTPAGNDSYYLHNNLQFEKPGDHAQDPKEPANSSINAPFHKFRWLHVPGLVHQGLKPLFGQYTYTVTPRYFDDRGSLRPLDPTLAATVDILVENFKKGSLTVGFTRGFVQSQAFVRHFGRDARIRPEGHELLFDTSQVSGTNAAGEKFTFEQQYEWLGFTARKLILDLLDEVIGDHTLSIDVFAYDLNEPDICKRLLALGKAERIRIILDNASLHHNTQEPTPEDDFEGRFLKTPSKDKIRRGKFGRYAHDKVFIVSDSSGPRKVLTGSTNFSVTGLYVNSNHVLVFEDAGVAKTYAGVFQESWDDHVKGAEFAKSEWAVGEFPFRQASLPNMVITFSPHEEEFARKILDGIVLRVAKEGKMPKHSGSVLFAVMQIDTTAAENPVYAALNEVHKSQTIFSFGISDRSDGIALYPLGKKTGVLVTGRPGSTVLPPPFDQVPGVGSGHQVHHKFVVCGFNGSDPVVYCGSSNLALKGEQVNGDNLLAIRDEDVATAFAIEALALVDHFNFLDRAAAGPKAKKKTKPSADKQQAALSAGWFLSTSDAWVKKYFDRSDLHFVDRELFAG